MSGPRARSRSRSPRAPQTPGYFRPPDSPLETAGPRRVSFGLPPATPAADGPGRTPPFVPPTTPPKSPAWFQHDVQHATGSFTPPPQTPLSPGAEQELARLAQGLGNVRTRGALVLARCLISSVLAQVEELRTARRRQLLADKLRQQQPSAPVLDPTRIAEMLGEEVEPEQDPQAQAEDPAEQELQKKVLATLEQLGQEVEGISTQAQLSISGAGKEVAWFMNHGKDDSVVQTATALVKRWKQDVGKGKSPVSVAKLATELEDGVFESGGLEERSHKKYYARIRELAGNLRHAPQTRKDLLDRKVQVAECVQWPKEHWWSDARRLKFQEDQARAAKNVIVKNADEFYDPTLRCPSCGKDGGRRVVLNEYSGWEGSRVHKNTCNACKHEWQSET